jgi:hypothetical protein
MMMMRRRRVTKVRRISEGEGGRCNDLLHEVI